MPEVLAVIPARWESTRFPGKPLADLAGKPLVWHVCERAREARLVNRVVVATDDERIAAAVREFGGEAVMTSTDHASGTDRVAEAVRTLGGDIVVNLQGDEPLIPPAVIDAVVERIAGDDSIVCATAAAPVEDEAEYADPSAVKVVLDCDGRALYFSRAPIPHDRDGGFGGALEHTGIYAFRRDFLDVFTGLEPTPLEEREKLEQLRMIEHGYRIGVVVSDYRATGVDTPADLDRVRRIIAD
jgi:3-deoxy-D-manno-octulosonate cytidylyltransferase